MSKRYCQNVDIASKDLIREAIMDCTKHKSTRKDVIEYFSRISGWDKSNVRQYLLEKSEGYEELVNKSVDLIRNEIVNKNIKIIPIRYHTKIDKSSYKVREIGIQSFKQQIYDYIAVYSLRPLLSTLGDYQCASIPNRGQEFGIRAIKRWLENPEIKYAAKMDVSKCYDSIDKNCLINFLKSKVKNNDIIWLIETLINTFRNGLSIGSYLSQYLCNLYMSQVYHKLQGDEYKGVKHTLIYMDDILVLGTDKESLRNDVLKIIKFIDEKMKLTIKPNWSLFKLKEHDWDKNGQLIEMLGYRVYRQGVDVRKRTYKRMRRVSKRIIEKLNKHEGTGIKMKRRFLAYNGKFKFSDLNDPIFTAAANYSKFCVRRQAKKEKYKKKS